MTATIVKFVPMAELPNRIRELRKAKPWKLEQLAERLGTSVSQLSDLERGNRELTYHWMRRIARELDVEPADLLLQQDNSLSLSPAERALVERYRQGSDDQRDQLTKLSEVIVPYRAEPPGRTGTKG